MYEYIEGRVAQRTPTRLVLDVAGVGYGMTVPMGSDFPDAGPARAWTHLVVRADALFLCGFPDRETRELFRLLLSVRGVGVSTSIAILSGLPPAELLEAIRSGDAARLTRVRGVGKKTADQILLDLRDKVWAFEPGEADAEAAPGPAGALVEDAVRALVSIGYPEKEARRNVERAARDADPDDLEQLVRGALAV